MMFQSRSSNIQHISKCCIFLVHLLQQISSSFSINQVYLLPLLKIHNKRDLFAIIRNNLRLLRCYSKFGVILFKNAKKRTFWDVHGWRCFQLQIVSPQACSRSLSSCSKTRHSKYLSRHCRCSRMNPETAVVC